MEFDEHGLEPGKVTSEQFNLLLKGTAIRGEKVIAALIDHLVHGVLASNACRKHEVNKGQFSARLKVMRQESKRAKELSVFY